MKDVLLYSDGACSGNPGPGGWAAILVYGDRERELSGSEPETRNNRMELRAVIEGLRALKEPCRVFVYSDSQYVIKAFTAGWIEAWVRRDWMKANREPVLNADLWKQLLAEVARPDVRWSWVRGHDGHGYNERCHAVAVSASEAARRSIAAPTRQGAADSVSTRPHGLRLTYRSEALAVVCPRCGAMAGDPCVGEREPREKALHAERHTLALSLGAPPLRPVTPDDTNSD